MSRNLVKITTDRNQNIDTVMNKSSLRYLRCSIATDWLDYELSKSTYIQQSDLLISSFRRGWIEAVDFHTGRRERSTGKL